MKKEYMKPQIMFESFAMSTNIAAGCESIIDTQSSGNCGLKFGDIVIFIADYTGCNTNDGVTVSEDDGQYNGICYHVFDDTKNLFNS